MTLKVHLLKDQVLLKSEKIENKLEKGLFGLRVELRKIEEELHNKIDNNSKEILEVQQELSHFQSEINDRFVVLREELHNEFTQFNAHMNEVLLEYKDSILIIQSHVDNQLIINKRYGFKDYLLGIELI